MVLPQPRGAVKILKLPGLILDRSSSVIIDDKNLRVSYDLGLAMVVMEEVEIKSFINTHPIFSILSIT